jgi:predicted phosphodiesterase
MRYGVISDVHGNLIALRSTVRTLSSEGVDAWLSVGDLIGYGPQPNECVELVAELGPIGVAGNHELAVLGQLAGASSSRRARATHAWTAEILRDDVRTYLARLPRHAEVDGMVLTHGSLDNPEEYVGSAVKALGQLKELASTYPTAKCLIVGNTHRQLLCAEDRGTLQVSHRAAMRLDLRRRHVLNPGSVGQSRQWEWPPRARAMIIDPDEANVRFYLIPYNVRAARRELTRHDLPYRSIHSVPPVRDALGRRLRRFGNFVKVVRSRNDAP